MSNSSVEKVNNSISIKLNFDKLAPDTKYLLKYKVYLKDEEALTELDTLHSSLREVKF